MVFNPQILDAMPIAHEINIGWAFHYFIAVGWVITFYVFFIGYPLFELPSRNGLFFGALTTLAPLSIFMPFTGRECSQEELKRRTCFAYSVSKTFCLWARDV